MSRISSAMLEAGYIPGDLGAFKNADGRLRLYDMGSSAPASTAPTSTQVTQTNIPDWAKPYAEKTLGQTAALTDLTQNPYQQYQGQRVADFNPLQQQTFQNVANMQVTPQTGQATGMAGLAGLGSLYAGQNYQNQATNPNAVSQFMSPYQQNVTDFQKQQAVNDYSRQLPGLNAQAVGQGAFGGSRQAIVQSEAQRNLQNTLAGIQATGTQNAFQNAQQAQQFGANLGLSGMNQANQAANTLLNAGQQNYGQQMGINAAQQAVGAQMQGQTQQGLTNQYQDFLNQQKYPYQQIGFMSDVLRGMPLTGTSTQSMYQAPPNQLAQLGGLGLGAYALGNIK